MAKYRLITAMITPYDEQLEVDYERAGDIAEYLVDHGSDGIVVCGTTGESPVLSTDEKLQLFAAVKARVGQRVEVWAGTGSYDTRAAVILSQEAQKVGVDGLLVVTPYYNKPSQEGLYQHFKAIADNVDLPVMLYNIPGRTGVNMLPETIARLAAIDNITSVKESTGMMDQLSAMKNILPDSFQIFSGDDSLTLPMLALGASGVVSIASHLVGKDIRQMLDAYGAGDVAKAQLIHNQLYPMFKGLFVTTNPIPVKEAMNMIGKQVGGLRLPLCCASEAELAGIRKLLADYKLLPLG